MANNTQFKRDFLLFWNPKSNRWVLEILSTRVNEDGSETKYDDPSAIFLGKNIRDLAQMLYESKIPIRGCDKVDTMNGEYVQDYGLVTATNTQLEIFNAEYRTVLNSSNRLIR